MAQYVDPQNFLPKGTINTLKSRGAWDVDDTGWEELITRLESSSISVIRAMANLTQLEQDPELLTELCTKHVQSQLTIPLIHMEGMQEQGELALTQFNQLMDIIKQNQVEIGITPDEENTKSVPGVIAFN